MHHKSQIDADVVDAYKSWTSPTFHFVTTSKVRGALQFAEEAMPSDISRSDKTDLNYDVCVTLDLMRGADRAELLISLVGPYAVLLDTRFGGRDSTKTVAQDDQRWADLRHALSSRGVEIVSLEELGRPLPLVLSLCGDGGCCVFNALFRDQSTNNLT